MPQFGTLNQKSLVPLSSDTIEGRGRKQDGHDTKRGSRGAYLWKNYSRANCPAKRHISSSHLCTCKSQQQRGAAAPLTHPEGAASWRLDQPQEALVRHAHMRRCEQVHAAGLTVGRRRLNQFIRGHRLLHAGVQAGLEAGMGQASQSNMRRTGTPASSIC